MDCPAPVIDAARQARIDAVMSGSPFNMFNIVALIVIAVAAFFLYKRYKDKQAVDTAHMFRPSPIIKPVDTSPIVMEAVAEPTTNEVSDE
jgi:hypothetical protein